MSRISAQSLLKRVPACHHDEMAGRPSPLRALFEIRATAELGAFAATALAMARFLPRGDGRPVLVLPGFMAGDASTKPLRALLCALGHDAQGWGLGRNLGPTDEILDGLMMKLDRLDKEDGPIDLVGWSLGGIYAREIARLAPSAVRQVITLGSPFQTSGPDESNAGAAFRALRDRHSSRVTFPRIPSWAREPMPVPTTSVYTRGDGIVTWQQCLNRDLPRTENVEVYGSHCGLGHNPSAVLVVADRLAHPAHEDWAPFRAPFAVRSLYPTPAVFDTTAA